MKTLLALLLFIPTLSWGSLNFDNFYEENEYDLTSITHCGEKFIDLEKLHNYLQDKDKAVFIVRRIEYFDVTKVIEIEDVEYLKF